MKIFGRPTFDALTPEELATRGVVGPLFTLLLSYMVEIDGYGTVVVPAGYETDWASIPPLARCYLDCDDPRILIPSLIHDYLYTKAGVFDPMEATLTRQECDDVLRRLMIHCGASASRAYVVYAAVRIGGASYWKPLAT